MALELRDGIPFQARARTVDHLGREQIADTPTAISELWKNSFDAYARSVELNVYDGDPTVATLLDDGHGMNIDEFVRRWLVVGTESKASAEETPTSDRNGLRLRLRQGQKGIGRLSCANLGPMLFLVSKRQRSRFVAALIDWRLFENPFVNLNDINIPVQELSELGEWVAVLPALSDVLVENLGTSKDDRGRRNRKAWAEYDRIRTEESALSGNVLLEAPSEAIRSLAKQLPFRPGHLARWAVEMGTASHGTALLIGDANYDLQAQLSNTPGDSTARVTRERFFETLSNFVDPFVDPSQPELNAIDPQFDYAVRAWHGSVATLILGSEKQFNRSMVDGMEHRLEGTIDASGVFRGWVRAFGRTVDEQCIIEAPKDLTFSSRTDGSVGPLDLFISSMEFDRRNSTHTDAEFAFYKDLAARYAGFMIFRDGLRVMPYGRPDNDFFEIDSRRSFHAGREFWNHRQMFGRLAISRRLNPNLKDKAGREGLVDNRAAKTLRELISNILRLSARRYFGSESDIRRELLPEIKGSNAKAKANEERNKLRRKQRTEFRRRLLAASEKLPRFVNEVREFAETVDIGNEAELVAAQSRLEDIRERQGSFRLPGAPKSLGSLEGQYATFRRNMAALQQSVQSISEAVEKGLETVVPASPTEALERRLARNAGQIHRRIQGWKRRIDVLQRGEFERIRQLVDERNKAFHAEATPIVQRVSAGQTNFIDATRLMDALRIRMDEDNETVFTSYIEALESLTESIDLQHLASFGSDEVGELTNEIERLNSLAQLGIAVEIVGHELQNYEEYIGSGLRGLPSSVRGSPAAKDIEFGYQGLADQLRFLSPLRLAGERVQAWITGGEIFDYVAEFFKITLANNKILFQCSDSFRRFRVFEARSRILPVFINLVNNSVYWLSVSSTMRREILISTVGKEVVVSDNGPGVKPEDVDSLFSLFFTRKLRGGRGVGLYLARANLAAGGHRIRYVVDTTKMPLSGANFAVEFRGAEFDVAGEV
jgi:signal transduction histidine kinase